MIFKDPWILLCLPLVIIFIVGLKMMRKAPSLRFPSLDLITGLGGSFKTRLLFIPPLLRLLTIGLFVVALAGPRLVLEETVYEAEGIDIVLAIDTSGSMAAEDFTINGKRHNRLQVVNAVVEEFIDQRTHDRIGLIAFAALAYTVSPLTTDYSWLQANLQRIDLGLIEDGTAVGAAISSSLGRLRNSNAKSKVVILLTDGVNNAGKIDPRTAAQAAKALGIKIYTIGAGTRGEVPFPVQDIWGRKRYRRVKIDLDENLLRYIAETTGGLYFRATDTESLREIYQQIDNLEKTIIEETGYREYKELFVYFLLGALGLLGLEHLLTNTFLLRIP